MNVYTDKKQDLTSASSVIDEKIFTQTLDLSSQGYCLFSSDLSIKWVNKKFCTLFSIIPEEITDKKVSTIFNDDPVFSVELSRLIDFNTLKLKSTTSAINKSGKRLLLTHSLTKINIPDDDQVFAWIVDDKSSYVQSREKLENEIKELLITIKSVGDGLITTDLSGTIQHINSEAERITGWQKSFIKYKTLNDVFIVIDEKTGIETTDRIKKAIDNKKSYDFSGNYVLVSKNGNRTPISFRVNRIENEAGIVKGVAIVFRDETENRRKQKNLIESEARFSAVFNSNIAGITLSNPETGMLIHVNQKFLDITGYTKDEVFSFSTLQLGVWYDYEARAKFVQELIKNGRVENAILKIKVKSGEIRMAQLSAELVRIGDEDFILSIINDITEKIRNEEILKKNKAILSSAIEIAHLGPWEYDIESDQFLLNEHFYKLLHTSIEREGSYTITPSEYIKRFVHPDDAEFVSSVIKNAVYKMEVSQATELEHRVIYADGGEGIITVRFFVEKNVNGKPIKTYGVNQDITKRKLIEKALENEKEELNVTLSNIRDGVISTNSNDTIILINQAVTDITGWLEPEVTGKSIIEFLEMLKTDYTSFAGKSKVSTIFGMQGDRQDTTSEALEIESKDGSKKIIYYDSAPIRDIDGSIKGNVYVLKDITQQAQIESQLQLSQKMEAVGQLAAGIAHEINTPMQYIMDNTMFLKDSFIGLRDYISCVNDNCPETITNSNIQNKKNDIDLDFLLNEIPSAIEQTELGIDRVSKIVLAMKDFSHPGQKEKTMADVNHGIEVTSIISKNEWKYFCDVELNLGKNLPSVFCNIDEINQVILNMIINAAHAIQEKNQKLNITDKGKIIISTREENSNIIITIEDNGGGIPAEIQDKIYNPFFTTKEVGKGTGQGLAIAHNIIVTNHCGKISVESIHGEGTKFQITMPLTESK